MKNITSFILILSTVGLLTGCIEETPSDTNETRIVEDELNTSIVEETPSDTNETRIVEDELNTSIVEETPQYHFVEGALFSASDAQSLDYFGTAVSTSEDYMLIGAHKENDTGAAYLFKKGADGNVSQLAKITASDPELDDYFGQAVAIFGEYMVVGAPAEDTTLFSAGSAYVFKRNSDNTVTQIAKLQAPTPTLLGSFGTAVAMTSNYVIIAASNSSQGSVHIFKIEANDTLTYVTNITAPGTPSGDGFAVSVAADGDYIVVGANTDSELGTASGAAYLFKSNTDTNVSLISKIHSSDTGALDYFGRSVAIDDDYIVIGTHQKIVDGEKIGAAYLFKRHSDTNVSEISKLLASDGQANDFFGYAVDVKKHFIAVGAYNEDSSGAVYMYKINSDTNITQTQKLKYTAGQTSDNFGVGIALSSDNLLIGASGYDGKTGASFIFEKQVQ